MATSLHVGLADDSVLIREALTSLIARARGCELVAVCTNAESSRAPSTSSPRRRVTDIRMPPTRSDEGIRLAVGLGRRTRRSASSC